MHSNDLVVVVVVYFIDRNENKISQRAEKQHIAVNYKQTVANKHVDHNITRQVENFSRKSPQPNETDDKLDQGLYGTSGLSKRQQR